MIVIAMFSVGGAYIIYFFKLVPLARKFDVMVIGFAVCLVFMLIAIIKYRMLDSTAAAKNYVVDELSEAIIVVDAEDKITYFNKSAGKLFPNLEDSIKRDENGMEMLKDFRTAAGDRAAAPSK